MELLQPDPYQPIIDYSREPQSDIAFIDMKSFYASVECVERQLNPLKTSLCVMSRADNSQGLILASSPKFKEVFGKSNVSRSYDLPFDVKTRTFDYYKAKKQGVPTDPKTVAKIEYWAKRTLIVPPRMGLYIEKNLEIQAVLENYAAREDILPYSIDEGFVDLTQSLNYFIPDANLSRQEKLWLLSGHIQLAIWRKTGIYSTVGLSNANPLLAKLALDNEAKKNPGLRANWSYPQVMTKVWAIPQLTDFWGIGERTAKRLREKCGIQSIYQLAHANPDLLKKEFGVMGVQLFFHANGVDESKVHRPYRPKSKGLGNSQVLPKNYVRKQDIELVLSEMAEQVAIRLRRAKKKTTCVSIFVGYSQEYDQKPISLQKKIDPTQTTKRLVQVVLDLFRQRYRGGPVRSIAVRYDGLVDQSLHLYSLFEEADLVDREEKLDRAVDTIRQKYGFLSLQKASTLLENSRMVTRSGLIGGHSAGGLDGLQ